MRRPIETEDELLQTVYQLFAEIDPETPDEVDEIIEAGGNDPEALAEQMDALIARVLTQSPLLWRMRAQREIRNKRLQLQSFISFDRPANREAVQELLEKLRVRNPSIYAYYRNFESESDEDFATFRAELEYLLSEADTEEE